MSDMFFDGWEPLFRTLVLGIGAYAALVLFLRMSGKRTLAKMNAFDFVVTVSLGSALATILLSKDVSLAQGALALGLLITLQFIVAWLSSRFDSAERVFKSEPTLLLRNGEPLPDAMRRHRVSFREIESAVRSSGLSDVSQAAAVILETDGTFSVISAERGGITVDDHAGIST